MPARFVVARNPDDASTLPYLLRIPVAGRPLLLKARDVWPRTSKVFCHPLDVWPADAEVVEEVDVRSCERRGRAVDLILDRGREHRSQFVFVTLRGGREAVFWQTAKTAAAARPGVRIPSRRAAGLDDLEIVVDTRERCGYRFATQQATVRRGCAACRRLRRRARRRCGRGGRAQVGGRPGQAPGRRPARVRHGRLATLPHAAVVVDGRYADALKSEHVQPGFVADLLARVAVRYPSVPVIFAGSRKLAEEWTYRYLATALAEARGDRDHG